MIPANSGSRCRDMPMLATSFKGCPLVHDCAKRLFLCFNEFYFNRQMILDLKKCKTKAGGTPGTSSFGASLAWLHSHAICIEWMASLNVLV